MSLMFEEVSFDHIGKGGAFNDRPLIEHCNEAMQRLAMLVLDEDRGDKASFTVVVKVERQAERNVVFSAAVKIAEPTREIRALGAVVTQDGEVLTTEHRQEAIDFGAKVTPINKEGAK